VKRASLALVVALALGGGVRAAQAADPLPAPTRASLEKLDRVVVRWHAQAAGGVATPRFVTARQLAFEARLEALTAGEAQPRRPYGDDHVRRALQRHITETLLASLPVTPKPTPKDVGRYAIEARRVLEERIGGATVLREAARVEGIDSDEVDAVMRRQARASWYLDKMVAPMLSPSELDLREAHRRGETPYTPRPYREIRAELRRWYVSTRLASALDRYFRSIRSRVTVRLIHP
jgi:hypothetical protein